MELHLSEQIAGLRRERKITQEELAGFLGVTKAAVSKWETGQTMPDILLLPQLANFFGITIDELIGYEPQLSPEQIRSYYQGLCEAFAKLPFSEAVKKTKSLVRRYYACYPFLLQVCVLYLNHFMLTGREEGEQILEEGVRLCDRILRECRDMAVCQDATALKAVLELQLGHGEAVIGILEPISDLSRLSGQNGTVLAQAYCMAGKLDEAKGYMQVKQYTELLNLIGDMIHFLSFYGDEPERCREFMRRAEGILELFGIDKLNPNLAAQYAYQAALVSAAHGEEKKALEMLRRFEQCVSRLLEMDQIRLHGDAYFDRLEEWLERLPLGDMAPRDRRFARESALNALSNPAFAGLREREEFEALQSKFREGGEKHA